MRVTPLAALIGLFGFGLGDPTWPSAVDELEEIMFQLESFRARKFADSVYPCTNEASGPGRVNAAEWLRTAFHDMATANVYFGQGGIDGSLQYELNNGQNKGPGLTTTLEFMSPYVSRRSSLADLVALGVYMSVRACGGPSVPIRAGRVDATSGSTRAVPQPQNSILSLQQTFDAMGFSPEEMIQVTACGHTIGGVHSNEFPEIVPPGAGTNGQIELDSTTHGFDNKVLTKYLDGTTKNPMVVGPSIKNDRNSDFKVFNSDNNATVEAMASPAAFRNACRTVLQKMIDVVPPKVELTDPISPYMVKPVNLQLTLTDGGSSLLFTGFIRVRTTQVSEDGIGRLVVRYKNRNGDSDCGSSDCTISTTVQGVGQGFDDTFAFFPIKTKIPASSGISSFAVIIHYTDGSKEELDNNGEGYPLQDAILLQLPQSCLRGSSGALTVTAAVRNDRVGQGAEVFVSYKMPQSRSPLPILRDTKVSLKKGECVGEYTLFSVEWTIPGDKPYETFIDVKNGNLADSFKSVIEAGATCREFTNPVACGGDEGGGGGGGEQPTSTFSSTASDPTGSGKSTTEAEASSTVSSEPPSEPTPRHIESVGSHTLVGCWTEPSNGRALNQRHTSSSDMTNAKCADFCADFRYFGTQYRRECYCGSHLRRNTAAAGDLDECGMSCAGDASSYCGGAARLELYMDESIVGGDPEQPAGAGDFSWYGCWEDDSGKAGGRVLRGEKTTGEDMTNAKCAEFCSDYSFFGTEYGRECWCGDEMEIEGVEHGKGEVAAGECDMLCSGSVLEYCGAGKRLSLYKKKDPEILGG